MGMYKTYKQTKCTEVYIRGKAAKQYAKRSRDTHYEEIKSTHHPWANTTIYTIIVNEVSLLRELTVTFSLHNILVVRSGPEGSL